MRVTFVSIAIIVNQNDTLGLQWKKYKNFLFFLTTFSKLFATIARLLFSGSVPTLWHREQVSKEHLSTLIK